VLVFEVESQKMSDKTRVLVNVFASKLEAQGVAIFNCLASRIKENHSDIV